MVVAVYTSIMCRRILRREPLNGDEYTHKSRDTLMNSVMVSRSAATGHPPRNRA